MFQNGTPYLALAEVAIKVDKCSGSGIELARTSFPSGSVIMPKKLIGTLATIFKGPSEKDPVLLGISEHHFFFGPSEPFL